jgi:pyruvate ferredoxin oxidoreductase gamma subunit
MIEVRFHGRGGQGAVTSAELLALAAIGEGRWAQAMPSFGPERRGAPVAAFARIDDQKIRLRIGITSPDLVVVLDPSLLGLPAVRAGLKRDGIVITNSMGSEADVRAVMNGYPGRLAIVDASTIAKDVLGVPITNTCMLGAIAKVLGYASLASFDEPMHERFEKIAAKNLAALKAAFDTTVIFEAR